MFQVGDRVVYGVHGICDITAQEEKTVDRKTVVYLVLEPQGQAGARYLVPAHNAAAMAKLKKMLSREELAELIASEPVHRNCWIQDENHRKQMYRELIGSGDRERLMAMVHTLYRHKKEQAEFGRKVHLCDDNFLRDAEKLLTSEVAVVMGMDQEAAKQFVRQSLQ